MAENPNQEKPHECTYSSCERRFKRFSNLKAHLLTHDPTRAKPYKCSYTGCERGFVRRIDCERHMLCHNKQRAETCPRCNKRLGRKDSLQRHKRLWCKVKAVSKKRSLKSPKSTDVDEEVFTVESVFATDKEESDLE